MPTYVYECRSCTKSFEVEQRITEDPLTDCECGGKVRRIIQPVGISFKGSGFYVNDSVAAATSKTETKTEPTVETKPDTPAPKVETKTAAKSE